jgi:hypothetical protein
VNSVDENNVVKGDGRKAGLVHETPGKTEGHPVVARGALNAEAERSWFRRGRRWKGPIAGQATEPVLSAEPPGHSVPTRQEVRYRTIRWTTIARPTSWVE